MTSAPVRRRTRPGRRYAAAVAAVGLLSSLLVSGASPAPTASAADGLSLGAPISLPNTAVSDTPMLLAGTGTSYIARPWVGADVYTPDNGKTWNPIPGEFSTNGEGAVDDQAMGYGGTFVGLKLIDDKTRRLQRWDPTSGAVTTFAVDLLNPFDDESIGLTVSDYVGSTVALNDGRVFAISGDQLTELHPAYSTTARYGRNYALSKDGSTVVRQGLDGSAKWGVLDIVPTNGGKGVTVRVDGLLGADVSGDRVHYLVGTKTSLRVCQAALATPRQATCVKLAGGDHRYATNEGNATLTTSAGADQVYFAYPSAKPDDRWIVQGKRHAKVSLTWLPFRDTDAPMAIAYSKAAKLELVSTVAGTGKVTPLFAGPPNSHAPTMLSLASGRATYLQTHYSRAEGITNHVWTRPLSSDAAGAETKVAATNASAVLATAARTAVQPERPTVRSKYTVVFYDGATKTGSYASKSRIPLIQASGPYALAYRTVLRADGKAMAQPKGWPAPVAVFGSLVVEADSTSRAAGRHFRVRDLERPSVAPIALALPQPSGRVYRTSKTTERIEWPMFGDWVAASYAQGDIYGQVVINYRTGQAYDFTTPGFIAAVGDGWVLHVNYDATPQATIQVLATGQKLDVPQGVHNGNVVTDGIRQVGWEDIDAQWHDTFKVAEINGLPASPVRLLGTVGGTSYTARGKAKWRPTFDLTKAVATGTLELRNSAGTLVRSLPTKASDTGSIRGVAWDGRDAAGQRVAKGSYTWTLKVAAADGSGAARSVDGLRAASGSMKVSR